MHQYTSKHRAHLFSHSPAASDFIIFLPLFLWSRYAGWLGNKSSIAWERSHWEGLVHAESRSERRARSKSPS